MNNLSIFTNIKTYEDTFNNIAALKVAVDADLVAMLASDNWECVNATLGIKKYRNETKLVVTCFYNDTDTQPSQCPRISTIKILVSDSVSAVQADYAAYIALGGAHLTAPKGVKNATSTPFVWKTSRRVATLINLSENIAENYTVVGPLLIGDSPYTVLGNDDIITVDSTGGAIVIQLPAIGSVIGRSIDIITIDITAAITITPDGAETTNGAASVNVGLAGVGVPRAYARVKVTAISATDWQVDYPV